MPCLGHVLPTALAVLLVISGPYLCPSMPKQRPPSHLQTPPQWNMHPVLTLQPSSAKLGRTHPTPPESPILGVLKDFRDRERHCYGVLHLSTTEHNHQPGWGQALTTGPPHVSNVSFKAYHDQPLSSFYKTASLLKQIQPLAWCPAQRSLHRLAYLGSNTLSGVADKGIPAEGLFVTCKKRHLVHSSGQQGHLTPYLVTVP